MEDVNTLYMGERKLNRGKQKYLVFNICSTLLIDVEGEEERVSNGS